ncbi:methyl-accepting chemotaxis protein [Eubacterium sp. MSJ-13]|uniref:methyl-accepting chemotaxis protein n=1 Tax=Eubacterium sp. MSJ-13 TaxID=2841513 RepID=UPI001C11C3F6|nr:methyl-accepting chemotaxis protein [Eubacterium sp. MSJ-13]MBU5478636.1 methyl-accepting chemotaxis protein [Eubacterium sp. MSJ-13]
MEKYFENKKVEGKLKLAFGMTLATLLVAIVVAVISISVMSNDMRKFYKEAYNNSTISMEIRKNLQYSGKMVLWSMTTTDTDKTNEYLNQVEKTGDNIKSNLDSIMKSYSDKKVTQELSDEFSNLKEIRETLVSYASNNYNDKALEVFNGDYNASVEKLQTLLGKISSNASKEAKTQYSTARTVGTVCLVLMIVIGISSVILSMRISKVIVNVLMKPIREIENATKKLKAGNLDVEIAYKSEDELGTLAANFEDACKFMHEVIVDAGELLGELSRGNFRVATKIEDKYVGEFNSLIMAMRSLRTDLSFTLSKINEASDQVAAGSEQLAGGAQVLAEGATEQAGAVQELTATVENVSNMASTVAEEAEESYQHVLTAVNHAEESKNNLTDLTNAMETISATSQEIQKIIGAIEDIASQTNLLSLNASIEAARAGEQGKGFAVVANQIGKLAADSAQSAVNTRELIEKSLVEVEHGNDITAKTVEALNEILEMMTEFAKASKQSSEVSKNQAEMLGQIEKGIEQISSVVQSNSASAEETSATSEELSAQSESLNELVGKFDLIEQPA